MCETDDIRITGIHVFIYFTNNVMTQQLLLATVTQLKSAAKRLAAICMLGCSSLGHVQPAVDSYSIHDRPISVNYSRDGMIKM